MTHLTVAYCEHVTLHSWACEIGNWTKVTIANANSEKIVRLAILAFDWKLTLEHFACRVAILFFFNRNLKQFKVTIINFVLMWMEIDSILSIFPKLSPKGHCCCEITHGVWNSVCLNHNRTNMALENYMPTNCTRSRWFCWFPLFFRENGTLLTKTISHLLINFNQKIRYSQLKSIGHC